MTALMGNSVRLPDGCVYFLKQQYGKRRRPRWPRESICYQLRVIDAPPHPHISHKDAHSCLSGKSWKKPRVSSADAVFLSVSAARRRSYPAVLSLRAEALVRKLSRVFPLVASWIGTRGSTQTPPSHPLGRRRSIAAFFCHCNEAKQRPEASLSLKAFHPPTIQLCLPFLLS